MYRRMHTNIPTEAHTGQRKSNFKINPFGEKKNESLQTSTSVGWL